jgi:hypothetical protein
VLVCIEQHLVFVAALGDAVFSTRGYIHFLRSGACSLFLGGLACGLDVHVYLGLDRVARGVRGFDVQLGRGLEWRMVSPTFPSSLAPADARPRKQLRPSKEQADLIGDPFGGFAVRVAAATHIVLQGHSHRARRGGEQTNCHEPPERAQRPTSEQGVTKRHGLGRSVERKRRTESCCALVWPFHHRHGAMATFSLATPCTKGPLCTPGHYF